MTRLRVPASPPALALSEPADDARLALRRLDPAFADRLGAEAERYERMQRRARLRLAALCIALAAAVVVGGLAGFGVETDTRLGPAWNIRSNGIVPVTIERARPHAAP